MPLHEVKVQRLEEIVRLSAKTTELSKRSLSQMPLSLGFVPTETETTTSSNQIIHFKENSAITISG